MFSRVFESSLKDSWPWLTMTKNKYIMIEHSSFWSWFLNGGHSWWWLEMHPGQPQPNTAYGSRKWWSSGPPPMTIHSCECVPLLLVDTFLVTIKMTLLLLVPNQQWLRSQLSSIIINRKQAFNKHKINRISSIKHLMWRGASTSPARGINQPRVGHRRPATTRPRPWSPESEAETRSMTCSMAQPSTVITMGILRVHHDHSNGDHGEWPWSHGGWWYLIVILRGFVVYDDQ